MKNGSESGSDIQITEKLFNAIPGMEESGWKYTDYKKILSEKSDVNFFTQCRNIIFKLKNNKNSWPFLKPVDPKQVLDYYDVIKEPMGKLICDV